MADPEQSVLYEQVIVSLLVEQAFPNRSGSKVQSGPVQVMEYDALPSAQVEKL